MSGRVRLARFEMTLDSYRRASGEGNKTDILLQHARHLPRTLFVNSGGVRLFDLPRLGNLLSRNDASLTCASGVRAAC